MARSNQQLGGSWVGGRCESGIRESISSWCKTRGYACVHNCADTRRSQSHYEHSIPRRAHSMCLLLWLVPQDIKLLGNLIAVDLAVVFPVQPLKDTLDALQLCSVEPLAFLLSPTRASFRFRRAHHGVIKTRFRHAEIKCGSDGRRDEASHRFSPCPAGTLPRRSSPEPAPCPAAASATRESRLSPLTAKTKKDRRGSEVGRKGGRKRKGRRVG